MPEKRIKVQTPQGPADAIEIGVAESSEPWTTVKLEDGSMLKIKSVIVSALRVDGQYDPEGNPLYMIKANQVMSVTAPDHLRKGGGGTPKGVQ